MYTTIQYIFFVVVFDMQSIRFFCLFFEVMNIGRVNHIKMYTHILYIVYT